MSGRRLKGQWKAKMFRWAWLHQRGVCAKCGCGERFIYRKGGVSGRYADGDLYQVVNRSSNLELDHIVALHCGGGNDSDNLQLLCVECHREKTQAEVSARAHQRRQALGRQILRVPA